MRIKTVLLSLVVACTLTSCRNPESNGSLVVQVGPSTATVLPLVQKSCEDLNDGTAEGSLGKASVYFSLFRYTWQGSLDFFAQYAVLKINSGFISGGEFSQILDGDEIALAMNGSNLITGGTTTTFRSNCGLRFGGINFTNPDKPAFLSGTIILYGIEVDADGNSSPVTAEAQVSLNYDGDPSAR
jgi:hypothetical protein